MTPDQQSKQLEFLKTALSRPGAQGGGGDPQYRDLTQKVQQLTEENNQRQAALVEMRNRYESDRQRKNQLNQEEQNIKQMEKDYKRNEEIQKKRLALDDKKDDIQWQKDIMKGNNEIGKMNVEERQLDFEQRKMKRELEKQNQEIAKKTAFNNLELKRKENEDLQNQIKANNQIMESEDYKKANEKWAEEERKNYNLRLELRNSQEALKRKEELDRKQREILMKKWEIDEYKKLRKQIPIQNNDGKTIFVYDPKSSYEAEDREGLQKYVQESDLLDQYLRAAQSEIDARNELRDHNNKIMQSNRIKNAELESKKFLNQKAIEGKTIELLSEEIKEKLQERARIDTDLEIESQKMKQLEDLRKTKEKEAYLKAREEQMKTPEYQQHQEELARNQAVIDFKNKENEVLKNGIKAQQAAAEQQARINTLNLFEKTEKEMSPETIGQVVAQVNQEGIKNMNENINKTLARNKINDFQNKFKEKYGDNGKPIFEGVLGYKGITEFNDNTPLDTLNKAANTLDYTYNNFGYFEDSEDPQEAFNTFVNGEGFQKL